MGTKWLRCDQIPSQTKKGCKQLSMNKWSGIDEQTFLKFVLLASHWTSPKLTPEVIQLKNIETDGNSNDEIFTSNPTWRVERLPWHSTRIPPEKRLRSINMSGLRADDTQKLDIDSKFVCVRRRRWPTFPRLIICVSEISPATRDTESFFRNYHKNRTVPIFHRQTRNGAFRCRRKKASAEAAAAAKV